MIAVENPHPFATTCFIRNTPLTRRLTVSIFILIEDAWWKQFGTSGNCSSFRLRGYRVQEYGATQRFQVRSILHFLVNINQTVRKRETLSIKGGGGRRNVHFYQLFDRCANKSTNSWTSRGRNFQANYSSFFPSSLRKLLGTRLLEIKLPFPRKRVKVICIIANSREFYTPLPSPVCLSADNSRLNKHSG